MHASGERLSQLTGIAAILRFPMPDLDLSDEHHHHHHQEDHNADNGALQPNPNRPINNSNDNNDDDQVEDNHRTLNENRAEASAW